MTAPDYVLTIHNFEYDAAVADAMVRHDVAKLFGLCDKHVDQIEVNIRFDKVVNGKAVKVTLYAEAFLNDNPSDDDGPDDDWNGLDPDGPDPHNAYNVMPTIEQLSAELSQL